MITIIRLFYISWKWENILHFSVCSAWHSASFRWLVVHFKTKTRVARYFNVQYVWDQSCHAVINRLNPRHHGRQQLFSMQRNLNFHSFLTAWRILLAEQSLVAELSPFKCVYQKRVKQKKQRRIFCARLHLFGTPCKHVCDYYVTQLCDSKVYPQTWANM